MHLEDSIVIEPYKTKGSFTKEKYKRGIPIIAIYISECICIYICMYTCIYTFMYVLIHI